MSKLFRILMETDVNFKCLQMYRMHMKSETGEIEVYLCPDHVQQPAIKKEPVYNAISESGEVEVHFCSDEGQLQQVSVKKEKTDNSVKSSSSNIMCQSQLSSVVSSLSQNSVSYQQPSTSSAVVTVSIIIVSLVNGIYKIYIFLLTKFSFHLWYLYIPHMSTLNVKSEMKQTNSFEHIVISARKLYCCYRGICYIVAAIMERR